MTPDIQQDTQPEIGPEIGLDVRQTVEDIFQTVCELPPDARDAYLDQVCSGDKALRREVEELLKFHESHETFLETPALQDAALQLANHLASSENQKEIQSDTLREGDWMLGPYRILDQLGKGGMGVVYLAEDTRDGKEVAIKVLPKDVDLDEDRLARFSREGRMLEELKHLKHPNIAQIYEQAEYDGKPCIALEYVPGDTLAERLRKGPLPIPEALQIGLQIADALESAHHQHIVHRDLKPANIKITPEGQVKILDFGLAKRFQGALANEEAGELHTRSMSLTESGMLLGTPAYMSPEQWNGQSIDQRADLWAFGCVLFEMLTAKPPFAGKSRAETMKSVFSANPNWQALPPGTPIVIHGLLLRCFQADPNLRLHSAKEAHRSITTAITENRFAPLLYLKTWFEKFDRRVKAVLAASTKKKVIVVATTLIFVTGLGLKYTPLNYLLFGDDSKVYNKDTDIAVLLQKKINEMTPDLVRAALMPNRQSLDDPLQNEQWKALLDTPDSKQAIEKIIQELRITIGRKNPSAQLYAILAQACLFKFYLTKDIKDKNDALQAVQKARSLNAESPEVLIVEGNTLNALGEYQEAIKAFTLARNQSPTNPEARNQSPTNPDISLGLALAHDLSGDDENLAEGFYKAAIETRSDKDRKRFWMDYDNFGWYYFDRGEYQRAANIWRKIPEINPFSPTGYINLGNAFLYLGCFNEAVKQYNDSITNGGETHDAHINLGAAYFYLGNYQDSIYHLSRIIKNPGAKEDTNLIEAWENIGDSYFQIGQIDDALEAYRAALELSNKFLLQFQYDEQMTAIKAELIAKINRVGPTVGQEDPIRLIERTINEKSKCLDCIATAVTVYHLVNRDNDALGMAWRAVEQGYSPFLLINNPGLAALRNRREFLKIQQVAQSKRGKC